MMGRYAPLPSILLENKPVSELLVEKLKQGDIIHTAWCGLGAPIVAEMLVRCGYRAVTLDMQHGLYSYAEARDGIAAVRMAGGHAIVRTPLDDFSVAARLLDCGAEAIIAPMINTVADAAALVGATKLPPVGGRSYGPVRFSQITGKPLGQPFLQSANEETLIIAMIETQEAVDNLDAILELDGIDGIFVGPSDLSVSLSRGARFDPTGDETMKVAVDAARKARAAGKIACGFANSPSQRMAFEDAGFSLLANGSDSGILAEGVKAMAPK